MEDVDSAPPMLSELAVSDTVVGLLLRVQSAEAETSGTGTTAIATVSDAHGTLALLCASSDLKAACAGASVVVDGTVESDGACLLFGGARLAAQRPDDESAAA